MRIYVNTSQGRWRAVAPEVPGQDAGDLPTRDEALARCRGLAAEEREAFARLGVPLEVDPTEELVEWKAPWWLIPESLVPVRPALVRAAVRRMDELAEELERFLDELDPSEWDRHRPNDWSIRMVLDHIASGCGVLARQLEPWPLDPIAAQATALRELRGRLEALVGERFVVEQFGMNYENRRVRWTPRKVLRVVLRLQQAWLDHLAGNGPEPKGLLDHDDAERDHEPLSTAELAALSERDEELLRAAERDKRVRAIGLGYRYYRDRLIRWPQHERERWHAMRGVFQQRLLGLDETELALVRVAPNGVCGTVRQALGVGISHIREHAEQMRQLRALT